MKIQEARPQPPGEDAVYQHVWRGGGARSDDGELVRKLRAAKEKNAKGQIRVLEARDDAGRSPVTHGPFLLLGTARTRLGAQMARLTNKYSRKELLLDEATGTCRVLLGGMEHYRFDLLV